MRGGRTDDDLPPPFIRGPDSAADPGHEVCMLTAAVFFPTRC